MGIHTYMYRASIEISLTENNSHFFSPSQDQPFFLYGSLKKHLKTTPEFFVQALYVYLCIKYLIFIYVYQMHTC